MSTNIHAETMRHFGACNYPSREFAGDPAIYQPGQYLNLRMLNGVVVLEVDCWTWMHDRGLIEGEFDVDTWEAMTLRFEQHPGIPARKFWREAFQMARGLVNGWSIEFPDVPKFTIEDWVAQVLAQPVVKIGPQTDLVDEDEIAAALGCSVEEVRQQAMREGWPYWQCNGTDQPMVYIEPEKRH